MRDHLCLDVLQSIGEPQIPGADRIDGEMDERMGLDADRMQGAGRLSDELGRIHAWGAQRFPQAGKRRVVGFGMSFDKF